MQINTCPIFTIYKATNSFNNKHYIGFDSKWPNRQKCHLRESKNKNDIPYWFFFHQKIREFGWDCFKWNILYQSKDLEHSLNMEKHFILEYNSHYQKGNGYNMTDGGEGTVGLKRPDVTEWNKIPKLQIVIDKMALSLSKQWRIIYPDMTETIIFNMKKFCRENTLNQAAMWKVANGIQTHHKNYKCYYIEV